MGIYVFIHVKETVPQAAVFNLSFEYTISYKSLVYNE
jgi:hypothetical protein